MDRAVYRQELGTALTAVRAAIVLQKQEFKGSGSLKDIKAQTNKLSDLYTLQRQLEDLSAVV